MVRYRRIFTIVLLAGICVGIGVRLSSFSGVFQQIRVSGASMADNLLGDHFASTCQDCGFRIRFDADDPPNGGRIVCPNCGFAQDASVHLVRHLGQRVVIDRWNHANVDRWQVVAVSNPEESGHFSVKRVVGLPGERISIADGDIFADGQICRKTLQQLDSMAIVVHDNAYRIGQPPDTRPRWLPEKTHSAWRNQEHEITFIPSLTSQNDRTNRSDDGFDWLAYRHWRCVANPLPREQESPLLDNYGYNQRVSRHLNRVTDLRVIANMQVAGDDGRLAFAIDDGRDVFELVAEPRSRILTLNRNDETVGNYQMPAAAYFKRFQIDLALFDHQLVMAIDGKEFIDHKYQPSTKHRPAIRPIKIGSDTLPLRIHRVTVLRDLYYLSPSGLDEQWISPTVLPKGHYFLLGDNTPISRDSRHWKQHGISRDKFIGRVHKSPFAR